MEPLRDLPPLVDILIICATATVDKSEVQGFKPTLIYLDDRNQITAQDTTYLFRGRESYVL